MNRPADTQRRSEASVDVCRHLERVAFALGAVVAAGGCAVLALWGTQSPALARLGLGWPRANTALALAVGGVSLMLLTWPTVRGPGRRLALGGGIFVALVGVLTLFQHVSGVYLGIDELLFEAVPETPSFWPPGRTSPSSALSFTLLGVALALVDVKFRRWRPTTTLSVVTLLLAFVAALVYVYRAGPLMGALARVAAMMPLTAALIALLGFGVLLTRPEQSFVSAVFGDTAGAHTARRLLPAAVIVPVLFGLVTTRTRLMGFHDAAFETVLQVAGSVAVLVGVIAWNSRALHYFDLERRRVSDELAQRAAELRALTDELEDRVELRTRELRAANAELESFSYSVSHDLRAPLRWIDGFSLALLEDYGDRLDETGREYVQNVREATQRMAALIDALLKLSRLTRSELTLERVDVSGMARELVEQLRRQDPGRRALVHVEPGIEARADPRLLRQALENLLRNAWKFTRTREEARIEVGTRDQGQVIFVRDNGVGFDPAQAHKLFRPFERLHSEDEFEGTGIGLAIVRRVVRRHGGQVWAEGAPERGATFYFTLGDPRATPAEEEA